MNNINLVPNQYEKSYSQKWIIITGIAGAALAVVLLVFAAFIPIYKIREEEDRKMALQRSLESSALAQVEEVMDEVELKESEKATLLASLEEIDLPTPVSRQTMDVIVGSAPKGLRMNTVDVSNLDNTITISGMAQHTEKIAEYIILLYNTKRFENISYTTKYEDTSKTGEWVEYDINIQGYIAEEVTEDPETEGDIEGETESEETEGEGVL